MPRNQLSDRDMLLDSIMTEKYVSSAYNTTILEAVNDNIVKTLQHIQQEDQNHAKLFFEAMHNHGWYDVQGARINQGAKNTINKQIANQLQERIQQMEQSNRNQNNFVN